jgi:hypothetical protein
MPKTKNFNNNYAKSERERKRVKELFPKYPLY